MISRLAAFIVKIKGEYLNTKDYKLFEPFYNGWFKRRIIKSGRQIGKSTAVAVKQLLEACLIPFTSLMSLFPLASQSNRFSKLYIDTMLRNSEILRDRIDRVRTNTIHLKQLNNDSELHYSYVGDNPDRIRGISVKKVYWDEIQDINTDHIPIAEQCTSHYKDSEFTYTGTPKTLDNTIEGLWKRSTQNEPFIVCTRCNFENFCIIPDVYKMITPEGLVCQKCGKILDMTDIHNVKYRMMDPTNKDSFEGWHIPRIFVPFNLVPEQWSEIIYNYNTYSQFQFATEVLGISFDTGGRPVTLEKLTQACGPRKMGDMRPNEFTIRVMGIDWGYATTNSLTVACILGMRPNGTFEVIQAKKFRYRDRLDQIKDLIKLYKDYDCKSVGADAGVGLTDNITLRRQLGPHNVYEYQYLNSKKIIHYNSETMQITTNRTKTLSLLFTDLNKINIRFPRIEDSKDFFNDILSVYEEVSETPVGEQKRYRRNHSIPDDFTHALNFAVLTMRLLTKDSILDTIINEPVLDGLDLDMML